MSNLTYCQPALLGLFRPPFCYLPVGRWTFDVDCSMFAPAPSPGGWSRTAVPRAVVIDDSAHSTRPVGRPKMLSSRPKRANLKEMVGGADWKVGVTGTSHQPCDWSTCQ